METMKALTLHRPWGGLFLVDSPKAKNVENRIWSCPLKVGEHFALHSGQKWDAKALAMAQKIGVDISPNPEDHPTGIIAFASFQGHVKRDFSPWSIHAFDQYHWHLKVEFIQPVAIPCPGQPGLWRVPDDVFIRLMPF